MDNVILVDLNDKEISSCEKIEAHTKGLLHRAFSLFVINDRKMLLQQRALGKYHSGGLWTNACCSHPRAGESLDAAVKRRTVQELGQCIDSFDELFSFVYRTDFGNVIEYEYDHVLLSCANLEHIKPDPLEITSLRWVDLEALKQELETQPSNFTSWFISAAPKVIQPFFED